VTQVFTELREGSHADFALSLDQDTLPPADQYATHAQMLALAREPLADLPYDSLRAVARFVELIDEKSKKRLKQRAHRKTLLKFVGLLYDGHLRNVIPMIADMMYLKKKYGFGKGWPGGEN
jgi:hypothetical protein